MCWSEKCCFCVRLDLGCIIIGLISLVLSSGLIGVLIVMTAEDGAYHHGINYLQDLMPLDLNSPSKNVIIGSNLFLAFLWIASSLMLIIGVTRNKSAFVLGYFAYGVFITFFLLLSSLLLLLSNFWQMAFILIVVAMIHVHFLVAVHTFYELQVRGKIMTSSITDDDVLLIEP